MSAIRRLFDGLSNALTGLGGAQQQRRGYCPNIVTQASIDAAWRGSAMLRKVVSIKPLDMIREGRDWQADTADVELLEDEEERLDILAKVYEALILQRLGGGAIIMGVPGDPDMPVNFRALNKRSIAFMHVVSRYQLTVKDIVTDPTNPLFGGPEFFEVSDGGRQRRIHPSRVIPFKRPKLSVLANSSADDAYWGEADIAGLIEPAMNLDEALSTFAYLIKDARNIDIGIPRLFELCATAEGEAQVMKRLALIPQAQSITNATVYDKGSDGKDGEQIDRHSMNWTGARDMILTFAEALAAAADIPMTRLWGKSAEGMNASGESQQKDWRKTIQAAQKLDLKPALDRLDAFLIPSALGRQDDKVWWTFAPLDTPSEREDADRFKVFMEAAEKVQSTATIPDVAFAKAMQNTLVENNWLNGLDGALAEIPPDERFGISPDDDGSDPSALTQQQEGGDPRNLAGGAGENGSEPARRAANDAAPRPLYVQRKLLNSAEFLRWAKKQGFAETLPADELHVTITYSRAPVDWMKMGESWSGKDGELIVEPGGARIVEALGDKGAVVLLFSSSSLSWRHEEMVRNGASHDYPEYQPHVTITYGMPEGMDLTAVEPFRGELRFGPEIFEELDVDYKPGAA